MEEWKTGISTVYWSDTKNKKNKKNKALLCLGKEEPHKVSWFDELIGGKLKVFDEELPITLLLKGPPGSGKSTFALELCYRLSLDNRRSTYLSFESKGNHIIQNAEKFGWENATGRMKIRNEKARVSSLITISGSERSEKWPKDADMLLAGDFINSLIRLCGLKLSEKTRKTFEDAYQVKYKIPPPANWEQSQILVIDSLNIISDKIEKSLIFQEILKITKNKENGIKLLVFILDGKSDEDKNPFWEYMCDTVIELNHHTENNYYFRTIEIVKARFQQHALGKHQFKIYDKPKSIQDIDKDTLSRLHPVREEGGIYIFPSVHFYLSKYGKFQQAGELEYDATYPKSFSDFLSTQNKVETSDENKNGQLESIGGFPKGRCTALIGCRGGHKSHLAYLHILSRLTGNYPDASSDDPEKNAALIISLRDDEGMIKTTLNGILNYQFPDKNPKVKRDIEHFINMERLEILYYPPGYISPEEFIHRIFVSIHKLKRNGRQVTVLFNSLDQIAARFPLCAKFDMFIPSIIQILIGESITSIFIAVDEKDQPVEQYGLLPMADLILSFHKYQLKQQEYSKIIMSDKFDKDEHGKNIYDSLELKIINQQSKNIDQYIKKDEVIVAVERFAGGKKAGGKGLLELGSKCLKNKSRIINFVKLPDEVYLDKNRLRK